MKKRNLVFWLSVLILAGCSENYLPKPRGYFRIDLPHKEYRLYDSIYPFSFEYPAYAKIKPRPSTEKNDYWIDIIFPAQKAAIYLSYKPLRDNLNTLTEDAHTFVVKHIPKAISIDEATLRDPVRKVYGIVWYIRGQEIASPCQFYLTDSTRHFIRGALYFNVKPNGDSLEPVIQYINTDIEHLASTLRWKNLR